MPHRERMYYMYVEDMQRRLLHIFAYWWWHYGWMGSEFSSFCNISFRCHTDKKENKIFLLYKEIQRGAVAKSYMTNGLLIYGEIVYLRISSYIRKPFLIYDFATAPLWISLYMRKIWFSFLTVHASSEHSRIFSLLSRWSIDDTSSEAESWLQGVEDTENLVAELDLVLVVTLRQVLYLQHIKYYFKFFLQGITYLQKKRPRIRA